MIIRSCPVLGEYIRLLDLHSRKPLTSLPRTSLEKALRCMLLNISSFTNRGGICTWSRGDERYGDAKAKFDW